MMDGVTVMRCVAAEDSAYPVHLPWAGMAEAYKHPVGRICDSPEQVDSI
jgi:hypothetical protein